MTEGVTPLNDIERIAPLNKKFERAVLLGVASLQLYFFMCGYTSSNLELETRFKSLFEYATLQKRRTI